MKAKFKNPRGTADILPQECQVWQYVEKKTKAVLDSFCYQEIRTPIFEETDLFCRSVGQATDIVQKQMLSLRPQASPDAGQSRATELSLRPEGTASIVRSYIQNGFAKKDRLNKFYYWGSMFRGERPQKGRLRQFHQVGVEAIGPGSCSPFLDAEIIYLSTKILEQVGIKDFQLKINTLGTKEDKLKFSKNLKQLLKNQNENLCEDCQNRFERNVLRVLDCKKKQCKEVVGKLNLDYSCYSKESIEYFDKVKKALELLNVKYEYCSSLVRGLDYYTHTVFEISSAALGSQDALGAGGRYSNLVADLGGPQVDAMGFALGLERMILALPKSLDLPDPFSVFVIALDEKYFDSVFRFVHVLRSQGINVDCDYALSSLKSQMRLANKVGADFVIIFGEEEIEKGYYTIKNMKSGEQQQFTQQEQVLEFFSCKMKG